MTTLTQGQRNTLLTAVKANGTAAAARTAGDTVALLSWLNGIAVPNVLAWRTAVTMQESDQAAVYTTYDSLTQGKRDSWNIFLKFTRNYSLNKVRNWVTDVWGTATASSVSEGILLGAVENQTNAQGALGGTLKTTGTVAAIDRTYVTQCDVDDANWLINAP